MKKRSRSEDIIENVIPTKLTKPSSFNNLFQDGYSGVSQLTKQVTMMGIDKVEDYDHFVDLGLESE